MTKVQWFVVLLIISLLAACNMAAPNLERDQKDPELRVTSDGRESPLKGTVEGVGTHFEVTDSDYLNVVLESTKPILLRLESIPKTVILLISLPPGETVESGEEAFTTEITLGGFKSSTTYFMYEDGYASGPEEFVTDDNGSYTFTQDLTESHLIYIQPEPSTQILTDSSTGGDCASGSNPIGTWNSVSKTCTLVRDVPESIEIAADGITLEGAGHLVNGAGTGSGIFTYRSNVTLRNLRIRNFSNGIHLYGGRNNLIENVDIGLVGYGVYLVGSNNNVIRRNTFSGSWGLVATWYSFTSSYSCGFGRTCRETVYVYSNGNSLYRNNFVNSSAWLSNGSTSNSFTDASARGNYWSGFTACVDANTDDICDSAYLVSNGAYDTQPWATRSAWSNARPVANVGGPYTANANQAITFDATSTSDADDDINQLRFAWVFGDGSSLNSGGPTPSHTYSQEGNYTVTLTVYDPYGKWSSDTATVTVINPDNTPPEISRSITGASGNDGWYRSDVTVVWNVVDEESDHTITDGCGGEDFTNIIDSDTNGTTLTCAAESAGGESSDSVTIKRDATVPTISAVADRAPNENGWYNASVTVGFSCQDAMSGIAEGACPAPVVTGTDTPAEGQSVSASVSDIAGNSATSNVVNIKLDTTPPAIVASATTADGSPYIGGWTNQTVTVSFTCSDALSGIDGSCPADVVIDGDTLINGQDVSATVSDRAGNSATSAVINVRVDKAAPTVAYVDRTTPNAHGWNNDNVIVNWSCEDDLSGVTSTNISETVSGEAADQSVTGTCRDGAGNTASDTQSGINIDKTKPTASADRSVAANAHGWNNVDITVSFSGTDSLSGIDTCSAPQSFGEGASQTATGTCTDKAGNTSDAVNATVNVDKTLPSISAASSYSAGTWTNQNVVVSFTCTDTLSDVASVDSPKTVSGEGANQSVSGTCTDKAGNSSSATFSTINIDKTAPVLAPSVSPNLVLLFGTATANPNASDGLSGVASASCGTVDTSSVGAKTVSCTATDNAGNTAAVDAPYSVNYNFTGFFNPINNSAVNVAKAGSGIPVKFSLSGNQGLGIMVSGSPSSQKISCDSSAPLDPVEETVTAGSSSLSYDALADQYVYVWKTDKAWAGTCRQLTVALNDGTSRSVNFKFTK